MPGNRGVAVGETILPEATLSPTASPTTLPSPTSSTTPTPTITPTATPVAVLVTVAPTAVSVAVGTSQTITGQVRDSTGSALAGAFVRWSLFPDPLSGVVTGRFTSQEGITDASGLVRAVVSTQATDSAGTSVVQLTVLGLATGAPLSSSVSATATISWSIPTPTPSPTATATV
ncbi:MAG: hypothetical protein HY332_09375, partial [Chloroflexi bacterium]|nr:hypothetical protein [Chloroflexota bacterium]